MRWIVVGLLAAGCGAEQAEVHESDASQLMNISLLAPTVSGTKLAKDCSKKPWKGSKRCGGPDGDQFASSAGADPNVMPNPDERGGWDQLELRSGVVYVGMDERGSVMVSMDEGETVAVVIDGAKDFADISFADEFDENGADVASVQVYLTGRDGTVFSGGEVGAFDLSAIEEKGR